MPTLLPSLTICEFGENRGKPHQPYKLQSSEAFICNYCTQPIIAEGTIWMTKPTYRHLEAENQHLRAALTALVAALRAPVEASAFGSEIAFVVYQEARLDVADKIAALLTDQP